MLKHEPRYDYVEESAQITDEAWRSLRRRKRSVRSLPVGMRQLHLSACIPMQSELQARFPHFGGKDLSARALQAENKRRHDLAASRGNLPLSRTSGDWHPITPTEISAALAAIKTKQLRETATQR